MIDSPSTPPPFSAAPTPAPGHLPPGRRVYAIGDVHGCLERLVTLHWSIAADLAAHPVEDSLLIHLGDYVDRGPDSAGVLQLLACDTLAPKVARRVNLLGNHEFMMRQALAGDRQHAGHWLDNGGEQTLESYGLQVPVAMKPEAWRRAVAPTAIAFLNGLEYKYTEGSYLFVHAGIRPGVTLKNQTAEDLLWIREPFLSDRAERDVVVVHGHTPKPEPEIFANRIGIDTGAVMGGRLTCLVLEDDTMRFLTA
jgi:serine/threonine protein phosphatase 1